MESHGAWKAGRWHKPFFMDQPGAFGATQWCEASAAEEGEHCHASAESSSTQCGLFLAEQRMRKASLFGPALSLFLFPVSPFFFFFFSPSTGADAKCQKPSESLHYIRQAEFADPLS